jgi:DNA repair protein RadC
MSKSTSDLKNHEQMTQGGKILGITVLDHLILSKMAIKVFKGKP